MILARRDLVEFVYKLRKNGKKIVFTNGCFDIIHYGHIGLLRKAKQLGDYLIVGINSDSSIKKLKGNERPIFKLQNRNEVLEAIKYIDHIIDFDELTPNNIIKLIQPDIHVKGGDYINKWMPEKEWIETHGGHVILIPLTEGVSTTKIIEKLKEKNK